jgi:hypothetical protein
MVMGSARRGVGDARIGVARAALREGLESFPVAQRPGDVPAVLKRPHPLAIKAARPPQP